MEKETAISLGSALVFSQAGINAAAGAIGISGTGTTIGSLNGAAFTSATAAWVGFGSMKVGLFIMGALPVVGALILLNSVFHNQRGGSLIDWEEEFWHDYEIQHELSELIQDVRSNPSHQFVSSGASGSVDPQKRIEMENEIREFKENIREEPQLVSSVVSGSSAHLKRRFDELEIEDELERLNLKNQEKSRRTWDEPSLSICESGESYFWVLWTSLIDAEEFLENAKKQIDSKYFWYGEVSSKEVAYAKARKLVPTFRQIDRKWAIEVHKILNPKPHQSNQSPPQREQPPVAEPQIKAQKTIVSTDELEDQLQQLQDLIGLAGVKSTVQELVNIAKVSRMQAQAGLKAPTITRHLVLTGNPGTGKTTVARILGKIYSKLGVLSKGHFVEVDRTQLVAGYVGQTAPKTTQVVESALGGVLFIDEAYSLVPEERKDPFGEEAINTLLRLMVDHADDLVVIVAGYKNEMTRFITSNPGLKSRFSRSIHFVDYSPAELVEIFKVLCKQHGYQFSAETLESVHQLVLGFEARIGELGNGRFMKNVFDRCIAIQCNRLAVSSNPSKNDLITFMASDVPTQKQLEEYLV
jgi:stage V sporulation protein K